MKNYTFEKNMKFKYQEELRQLNVPCPPDDYIATTVDLVYRWVFEEIEDERRGSLAERAEARIEHALHVPAAVRAGSNFSFFY